MRDCQRSASHTRHRILWVGLWLEKNAQTRFGN
jgi:hypothetical protein